MGEQALQTKEKAAEASLRYLTLPGGIRLDGAAAKLYLGAIEKRLDSTAIIALNLPKRYYGQKAVQSWKAGNYTAANFYLNAGNFSSGERSELAGKTYDELAKQRDQSFASGDYIGAMDFNESARSIAFIFQMRDGIAETFGKAAAIELKLTGKSY